MDKRPYGTQPVKGRKMKRIMEYTDKRTRRTVHLIQTTTLQMLCGQRIDEIRIIDLCGKADINRTTFYLHFRGITDVLDALHEEIVERIFTQETVSFDFSKPFEAIEFLNACSSVLASYKHLDSFLCHSEDADYFLSGLKNRFCKKLDLIHKERVHTSAEACYVIRFLASGMLDTYVQWLKTDRKIPLQEVFSSCAPIIEAGRALLV